MSRLWDDIQREPGELRRCLRLAISDGAAAMEKAGELARGARHVIITGLGASWHAGMAVQHLFHVNGLPAHLVETAELQHMWPVPPDTALIVLSRSGRSAEIAPVLEKAARSQARIIAVTNDPESPLASRADLVLPLHVAFDTAASIATYTAPALIGGLLALSTTGSLNEGIVQTLAEVLSQVDECIPAWRAMIRKSEWLLADAPTFFLARGASLASCHEARLLWFEVGRAASSAMSTTTFRHGPQEILAAGEVRVALWIDPTRSRERDLRLAAELRNRKVNLMLIGQALERDTRDFVLSLPEIPGDWQFLIDIIPLQIAAELYGHLRGYDCDRFLVSSYVIQSDDGL